MGTRMTEQTSSGNPSQTEPNDSTPPAAFCQNCGKPLDKESARVVGASVFCEPCLSARVHGNPGGVPSGAQGYSPWTNPVWPTGGIGSATPNPRLATLLGFIPGVGAMYNEQYAKGIVHLIVFAVLVSLVDANGIFLLFVFGWVFYMAFEARHTAIARRDGTQLPNPFGLNEIGERFGFGRAWPAQPRSTPTGAAATRPPFTGAGSAGWADPAGSTSRTPEVPGWGAPVDEYAQPKSSQSGQPDSYATADPYQVPPSGAHMPPYGYGPYTAPPYNPTFNANYVPPMPGDPGYIAPPSRFPGGAVWLIGLGTLFLLSTTGIFNGIEGGVLVGLLLIGLGVWLFLRRVIDGGSAADPASPGYGLRIFRAARSSLWLVLLGVLFLLSELHILSWHRSWPLIIIAAGVMALLERVAWSNASMGSAAPISPSQPSTPPRSTSMSVVPTADPTDPDAQKGGR
jgi:hypothetical protein